MAKTITKGKIGNALTSTANDHVVAVANDIYDETLDKYLSQINNEVEQSVFVEIHDPEEEVSQPEFINVEDATYAYNWKSTDTPANDGSTQGNLKDLYEKALNQDSKLSELGQKVDDITGINELKEITSQELKNIKYDGSKFIIDTAWKSSVQKLTAGMSFQLIGVAPEPIQTACVFDVNPEALGSATSTNQLHKFIGNWEDFAYTAEQDCWVFLMWASSVTFTSIQYALKKDSVIDKKYVNISPQILADDVKLIVRNNIDAINIDDITDNEPKDVRKEITSTLMQSWSCENAQNKVRASANGSLDTIWFIADRNFSMYYIEEPSAKYYAVTIGRNASGDWYDSGDYKLYSVASSERYRKSDTNLPTRTNKLSVNVGDLVCITMTKETAAYWYEEEPSRFLSEDIALSKLHIDSVIEALPKEDDEDMTCEISGTYLNISSPVVRFSLGNRNMSGANLNTFALLYGYLTKDDFLIWNNDEDAEGVVKLLGETDFIGGYHGSEQMTDKKIIIDGTLFTASSLAKKTCNNVTVIVESDVYHCWRDSDVSDNVAFHRTKKLVFTKNKVSISNHWVSIGENKVISAPLMLMQCKYGDDRLKYYTDNTDCKLWSVPKASDAPMPERSKAMTQGTLFLDGATITTTALKGIDNEHYRGYVSNFYSQNRIKFYFNYIYNVLTGVTYNNGDSLDTEFDIVAE